MDKDLLIRGNSIYAIVDGPSWKEAAANANKLGGHLVTINDQQEDDYLTSKFNHLLDVIGHTNNIKLPYPESHSLWWLTNKAVSNGATRDTQGIHEFIEAGIEEKTLDVDGDGSVTALGDGLMIIRKLFGTAFAGDKLTDKAISNNATRTTDEIHEYIDAMTTLDTIA